MILGIHHIALIVSSDKTLLFYKRLGFTESFRKKRENDTVVLLDGFGIQLEIFIDGRHLKREEGLHEPLGIRHFSLKVDSSLEEVIAKIEADSIDVGSIMTDWIGERFVFIKDPDGNIVELHE